MGLALPGEALSGSDAAGDDAPLQLRSKGVPAAELDMTPMIDITFLLLIFFVVNAIVQRSAALDLAQARHGGGVPPEEAVILCITAPRESAASQAAVYLGDGTNDAAQVGGDETQQEARIRGFVEGGQREGKKRVLIKAERGVKHKEVARVAAAAARDGMTLHLGVFEAK